MDSSASFHASSNKSLIKNFKVRNFGKVRLAYYETLDITGVRDINLRTFASIVWSLKNVRYIPRLKRMLISVGMADVQGYRVIFEEDW